MEAEHARARAGRRSRRSASRKQVEPLRGSRRVPKSSSPVSVARLLRAGPSASSGQSAAISVHEGADLLDLRREPRDVEVVDVHWLRSHHGATLSVTLVT